MMGDRKKEKVYREIHSLILESGKNWDQVLQNSISKNGFKNVLMQGLSLFSQGKIINVTENFLKGFLMKDELLGLSKASFTVEG